MLGSESGPFKRTPGFLASFCLPWTDGLPVDFHSQILWGLLFLTLVLRAAELGVELGPLALHGGPLQPKYPSQFSTATHECGASPFHVSTLLQF